MEVLKAELPGKQTSKGPEEPGMDIPGKETVREIGGQIDKLLYGFSCVTTADNYNCNM